MRGGIKEKERFIRNQEEYYKRKQQERDAESEKVKGTLNDKIERLGVWIEEGVKFRRHQEDYYKWKQQERDAVSEKEKGAFSDVIKRLEQRVAISKQEKSALNDKILIQQKQIEERDTTIRNREEYYKRMQERAAIRESNLTGVINRLHKQAEEIDRFIRGILLKDEAARKRR